MNIDSAKYCGRVLVGKSVTITLTLLNESFQPDCLWRCGVYVLHAACYPELDPHLVFNKQKYIV